MFFGVSVSESFLKMTILWGFCFCYSFGFIGFFLLLVEVRKIKFSAPFHELFKPDPDVGGVGVNNLCCPHWFFCEEDWDRSLYGLRVEPLHR